MEHCNPYKIEPTLIRDGDKGDGQRGHREGDGDKGDGQRGHREGFQ